MKLIRFGLAENERPGVITAEGTWIDVSAFGEDYNEIFFAGDGIAKLSTWLDSNKDSCPVVEQETRLGPPICRPSKIICVGLNYAKHARESGMEAPTQPVIFYKATTSIIGINDTIVIPKRSEKTDWEVELAVIIGKKAKYIEENEALDYVAGYMLHNDVSERAFQLEQGGQWLKGKSADTFAPIGPFLATTDKIQDPQNLDLWLKLNGEKIQESNTSDMIFNIAHQISYISQYMTLLPGDMISTGTPSGVGLGMNPPKYLKEGDVVVLGIDQLGSGRQEVVNYK